MKSKSRSNNENFNRSRQWILSDNYWQLLCSLERTFDLWPTKYVVSHTSSIHKHYALSLLYFVHNEEYLRVCLPYHLWIVFGPTPSIPSSCILGGQHPAVLSDRSRKPLRLERTSPLTHSGATCGYLYTQLFAQQQVKVLKYWKILYNKVSNIWNNFIFQNICSNNALPRNNSKLGKVHLTTRLGPLEP